MAFNIDEFRSALKHGGARASLFQVTVTTPPIGDLTNLKFLCKTTSIPPSTLTSFDVPYLGRSIKVAGERTFAEWSTTIINDEDFGIRNSLEQWMNLIKSHKEIKQNGPTVREYQKDITLDQYNKSGNVIKSYKFINAWPTTIAEIPLDTGSADIEEFTCTWNYDYWESDLEARKGGPPS